MANHLTSIYYLHRGDNLPFYIGKTIRSCNSRLNCHRHFYGKNLFLERMDEIPTTEWEFWEKWYISLFKSWGFILENKNDGGGGCITHNVSPKARESIGRAHRGIKKTFSTEHKLNLSKSLKGRILSTSHKQKISTSLKGRKVTWDTSRNKAMKSILQYDLDGNFIKRWGSIIEASKIYKGHIGGVLSGRQKTSSNYFWKYEY